MCCVAMCASVLYVTHIHMYISQTQLHDIILLNTQMVLGFAQLLNIERVQNIAYYSSVSKVELHRQFAVQECNTNEQGARISQSLTDHIIFSQQPTFCVTDDLRHQALQCLTSCSSAPDDHLVLKVRFPLPQISVGQWISYQLVRAAKWAQDIWYY